MDETRVRAILVVSKYYRALDNAGAVCIFPEDLADLAFREINDWPGVGLVIDRTIEQVYQVALEVCWERQIQEEQAFKEGQLLRRYPATRDGGQVYVLLGSLALEELEQNIERLKGEANAKLIHAHALQARKEILITEGPFSDKLATKV